jgi:thymidine kinase
VAKFEFFHGVMGSGKGVFVAQMVHNTRSRGIEPITMKPGIDTKGGDFIVSRIGTSVPVDIMAQPASPEAPETDVYHATIKHMSERAITTAHLIVDEAQFLSPQQVEQLYDLAKKTELPVTCFGLKANVYRALFEGSARLIALATTHELQTAVRCAGCGETPEHNGRYIDGLFDTNSTGPVVKIDGDSQTHETVVYDVFCTDCYDIEVEKSLQGIKALPQGI